MSFRVILIGLLFCSCLRDNTPMRDKLLNQVISEQSAWAFVNYGLLLEGEGGALKNDKISNISLSFRIKGCKDLNSMRNLIVELNKDLLKRINENKTLNNYLIE